MADNRYICPLAFGAVHYDMDNRMGPCSLNNIVDATTIEEYLKHPKLIQLKTDMKNGIRNPSCNACYNLEDHNLKTNRLFWLSKTNETVFDSDEISHLEIRFSNICNSKCRTCVPNTSSSIAAEEKKYGRWDFSVLRYSGPSENFVLDESKTIANNLKTVTFSGGEPLLQWQHWEFLDYLIENNLDPQLLYYSNASTFTFKNQHIFDKWKQFSEVVFRISIDAVEGVAEYWRPGAAWNTIIDNIKQLKEVMPNVKIQYTLTISWPNVFQIEKIIDALSSDGNYERKVNFNLVQSKWYNLQVLPKNMKLRVEEYFNSISEYKIDPLLLNNLVSYMNDNDNSNLMSGAIKRLKEIDVRRGESFIDMFPEYKEMAIEYGY